MDSLAAGVPQLLRLLPHIEEDDDKQPEWPCVKEEDEEEEEPARLKEEMEEVEIAQQAGERLEVLLHVKTEDDDEADTSDVLLAGASVKEDDQSPPPPPDGDQQEWEIDVLLPPLSESPDSDEEPRGKPYRCLWCPKAFTRRTLWKSHVKTHVRKEKPFACSRCGQRFFRKTTLLKHTRAHAGDKRFLRAVCGKKLTSRSSLKAHARRHAVNETSGCSVCREGFATIGQLTAHAKEHHGEKPFACSVCRRRFTLKSHLTAHMRSHASEKPFSCSSCARAFAHQRDLKAHVKERHEPESSGRPDNQRKSDRRQTSGIGATRCCVPSCQASSNDNDGDGDGGPLSFFPFPENEELRRQWMAAIPRDNLRVTQHTRVCGRHFRKKDVRKSRFAKGRRSLKEGAVPVLFERIRDTRTPAEKQTRRHSSSDKAAEEAKSRANRIAAEHDYAAARPRRGGRSPAGPEASRSNNMVFLSAQPSDGRLAEGLRSNLYRGVISALPEPAALKIREVYGDLPAHLAPAITTMLVSPHVPCVRSLFGPVQRGSVLSYQMAAKSALWTRPHADAPPPPRLPLADYRLGPPARSFALTPRQERHVAGLRTPLELAHELERATRGQRAERATRGQRIPSDSFKEICGAGAGAALAGRLLDPAAAQTTADERRALHLGPAAVEDYCRAMDVNRYPCGLLVHPDAPWMATSPHGVVFDPKGRPAFGLLEVKCCDARTFADWRFAVRPDGGFGLHEGHPTFWRIQGHLMISGCRWCDFVVHAQEDMLVQRIPRHDDVIAAIKSKVDSFFFSSFLNACLSDERQMQNGG
ncbi:uncharacterized protein LOC144018136 [Festucalex cinctus]